MEKRRPSIVARIAELTWRELPRPSPSGRARPVSRNVNPTSKRIRDALRRWFEEEL